MKLKKHLINPILLGIFFLVLGTVSAQYIDTHITRFTIIDLEDESRQEDAEEEEYLAPISPLPTVSAPYEDVDGNVDEGQVYVLR